MIDYYIHERDNWTNFRWDESQVSLSISDDRAENAEAGKRFGFQSVLVKANHLEEHQEWQEIIKN